MGSASRQVLERSQHRRIDAAATPDVLQAAILLHPMVPFEPGGPVDLDGMRLVIGAGRLDPDRRTLAAAGWLRGF